MGPEGRHLRGIYFFRVQSSLFHLCLSWAAFGHTGFTHSASADVYRKEFHNFPPVPGTGGPNGAYRVDRPPSPVSHLKGKYFFSCAFHGPPSGIQVSLGHSLSHFIFGLTNHANTPSDRRVIQAVTSGWDKISPSPATI